VCFVDKRLEKEWYCFWCYLLFFLLFVVLLAVKAVVRGGVAVLSKEVFLGAYCDEGKCQRRVVV
jgi:hypothetical protein